MTKSRKRQQHKVKLIHPKSRHASQLRKKTYRKDKIEGKKAMKQSETTHKISKLLWFRTEIDESKSHYSMEEMQDLVENHLHRLDKELESIETLHQLPRRHGRQYGSREDTIRATIERERQLFDAGPGFEAPDLLDPAKLETFRSWDGDERLLQNVPLRLYSCKPSS